MKNKDGVLGMRTRGCRRHKIEGKDESTELPWQPINATYLNWSLVCNGQKYLALKWPSLVRITLSFNTILLVYSFEWQKSLCRSFLFSVTRIGKISPLWLKFKDLWQFLAGSFRIWQHFLPNSEKIKFLG